MTDSQAEKDFAASPIYRTLRDRLRANPPKDGVLEITQAEIDELEEAAPVWKRFVTREGDFTLDIWGTRFRVKKPKEL